jgi:hypothetical protein
MAKLFDFVTASEALSNAATAVAARPTPKAQLTENLVKRSDRVGAAALSGR